MAYIAYNDVCYFVWQGVLVMSRPLNGCAAIEPPPPLPPSYDANTTKFVVLIRRYDCNFDIKVRSVWCWIILGVCEGNWSNVPNWFQVWHAQQAGYDAAIIHNMYSDNLLNMNFSNGNYLTLTYVQFQAWCVPTYEDDKDSAFVFFLF